MTAACERSRRFPAPRRWEMPSQGPGDPRRITRPVMAPSAPTPVTPMPLFDGEAPDDWQFGDAGI